MKASRHSFQQLSDNEFMNDSNHDLKKLQSRGMLNHRSMSKDLRLKKLEQKNQKLQREVNKVARVLSSMSVEDKNTHGIKLPEIKPQVIDKELENAYKMIKQYEVEINNRKKYEFDGVYADKLRKFDNILKEKQAFAQKLKKQVHQTKKKTLQYTRLLKDNTLKNDNENKTNQINTDIKWLRDKLREFELKRQSSLTRMKKQSDMIKKYEKELGQSYASNYFDDLRATIFTNENPHVFEADENPEKGAKEEKEEIQDRTSDFYHSLVAQTKLYQKLDKDYEQKIVILSKGKEEASEKNFKSRNKLLEIQYEIETIEAEIAVIKKRIDPLKIKSTKGKSLFALQKNRYRSAIVLKKSTKLSIAHSYKFKEIGEITKEGKRFTDRTILGSNTVSKIVQITFYLVNEGQNRILTGLKAGYSTKTGMKSGNPNLLVDRKKEEVEQEHYKLSKDDYFKTVDCIQDSLGVIVGIIMVSHNNVIVKAGLLSGNRNNIPMEPNQMPACLFGCLLGKGMAMLGVELGNEE